MSQGRGKRGSQLQQGRGGDRCSLARPKHSHVYSVVHKEQRSRAPAELQSLRGGSSRWGCGGLVGRVQSSCGTALTRSTTATAGEVGWHRMAWPQLTNG